MSEYVILANSTCDVTKEMEAELELEMLSLSVNIGKDTYKEFDSKEFYQQIREGAMPSTNAVNIGEYIEAIEPILEGGRDVLVLAFSSGLSTTYNSAAMAVSELAEKYPDRKVYAIDTLSASMGEGLLTWYAAKRKQAGQSIDEVRDWVLDNRLKLCHWFTVDDLHHLKRGGRVSSATAVIGSMLNIKPVLHVDNEGHLISVDKARGRQASLLKLLTRMEKTAINPSEQTIFISHSDCEEDARWLGEKIKERLGVKEVVINFVGPVIGSHTGIGTVALFFIGTER